LGGLSGQTRRRECLSPCTCLCCCCRSFISVGRRPCRCLLRR
jgi:hypothetical protein